MERTYRELKDFLPVTVYARKSGTVLAYDTQERNLSNIRKELRSLKTRPVNSSARHMMSLVSQKTEVISLSYRGVEPTHFRFFS